VEDEALLAALRAGDEVAFASLVRRWHRPLVRFARAQVPTDALAEDVAQETWLAALRGLDRFEGRSSLGTWLFGIARNLARRRGAAEARLVPLSALAEAAGPTVDPGRFAADGPWKGHWVDGVRRWPQPDDAALARERLDVVRAAIAALPPAQRLVITMRDVDGLSGPEVAGLLEISEGNQRVLLHRARATVRASLAVLVGEEP
jgi:RNA polymerase sigma-70 factor (ECF subfamily)